MIKILSANLTYDLEEKGRAATNLRLGLREAKAKEKKEQAETAERIKALEEQLLSHQNEKEEQDEQNARLAFYEEKLTALVNTEVIDNNLNSKRVAREEQIPASVNSSLLKGFESKLQMPNSANNRNGKNVEMAQK